MDPTLSMALAVRASKGGYALLLGSGISRAAGVPTGWEVVLDLIYQLAAANGEACPPDPVAWYVSKFDRSPDYSDLIEALAHTPTERRQLLRRYFEPNADERAEGKKLPTAAHKAIAELFQRGYLRIAITTNFDHLLENALGAIGVHPTVISAPDACEGLVPLAHVEHLIVKVHGDYLDTRIKNTPNELSAFDPRIDQLLDRILDEFGLIVSGWSAEWDGALRAAIERCATHRFTTYWSVVGEPTEAAERLVALRRAEVLQDSPADELFTRLCTQLRSLEEVDRVHPLSVKAAVATVKRLLADDRSAIALHDFLMGEAQAVQDSLMEPAMSLNPAFSTDEFIRRVAFLEARVEMMLAVFAASCFWGTSAHRPVLAKALETVADPGRTAGPTGWQRLLRYPALLCLYAGGIAAIAADNYATLVSLLYDTAISDGSVDQPASNILNTWEIIEDVRTQRLLPGMERHYTPLSERIFEVIREPLREALPRAQRYEQAFDRFEYLLALACNNSSLGESWGPVGCFLWRRSIVDLIGHEIESEGENWSPCRAGFRGGNLDQLRARKSAFDNFLADLARSQGVR